MTREEARKNLSEILTEATEFEDSVSYVTEEDREPLEMAIKALEQEPTEFEEIDFVQEHKKIPVTLDLTPCEDAISRQAVLDLINADWKYEGLEVPVNSLPPVNPQPKTGHWINIDETHSKCDRCGAVFEISSENGEVNYCPNCGAKMQEIEE